MAFACERHTSKEIIPFEKQDFPTDSSHFYFPLETFKDTALFDGYDTFVVSWYSEHLFAMKEPILFNNQNEFEIFRFTWLRTFHNPVVIRIQKNENQYQLIWKVCDGAGGYDPGNLVVDKKRIIREEEWNEFQEIIDSIDFWNLPTNEREILGTDGSQWILEGAVQGKYHVIDRWTPHENSPAYQLGNYLISISSLKIDEENKY